MPGVTSGSSFQSGLSYIKIMLQLLLLFSLLLLLVKPIMSDVVSEVVLVTHESSVVESISIPEIRRLYLGFPVSSNGINKPVINRTTSKIYADFLKNIMHMTEDGYKRKIIRRVFRYGSDYIKELDSLEIIVRHLEEHPGDVVFVYMKDIPQMGNVKIVMRLW